MKSQFNDRKCQTMNLRQNFKIQNQIKNQKLGQTINNR